MGLDMFLHKKIGIYAMYKHENINGTVFLTKDGLEIPIKMNMITSITEQAAYWRKANQIHNWFVENCQNGQDDCGEYEVTLGQLKELLKLCKEVAKHPEKGPELLPVKVGPFFGSFEYGQSYMIDIKETIRQLTPILKEKFPDGIYVSYYYNSSW